MWPIGDNLSMFLAEAVVLYGKVQIHIHMITQGRVDKGRKVGGKNKCLNELCVLVVSFH